MTTLFLKYRPQVFSDVVGQTPVIRTLQNALKSGKPAHAYLFSGSRGTGKTSTARIFAKMLNCPEITSGEECMNDPICKAITEGSLVDVIEIDAASNRGIDEIRDLREKIQFAPNIAKYKVYIIDEVHMLTKEAFNALLKTLEEPPEHAYFVLATTELHKVPETIVSRCQTFIFQRFTIEQLVEHLKYICKEEEFTYESEALELIAKKAEGGLRDAISLCEQIAAETENNITAQAVRDSLGISSTETLETFFAALRERNGKSGMDVIHQVAANGGDFRTFGHDLLLHLREKLHQHLENREEVHIILQSIEEVEKALGRLKTTPIVELPFEIAVMNLCSGSTMPEKTPTPPPTMEQKAAPSPAPETKPTPMPVEKDEEAPAEPKKENGFTFEEENIAKERPSEKAEPERKPTGLANDGGNGLTLEAIRSAMRTAGQNASVTPSVRNSFLAAQPRLNGGKVLFSVNSDFHYQSLSKPANRVPLQEALGKILEQAVQIEFQKDEKMASANDFQDLFG